MGLFRFLRRLFFGESPPPLPRDPAWQNPPTFSQTQTQRPQPASASPPASGSKAAPQSRTLNLDPGQFAPVSTADAKKQAANIKWSWATVNFDRRDAIPPLGEPRTELIDRAMVGLGLLTPEQLVEIHKVGEQVAELRPALRTASAQAEAAVARDAAGRRALKEQKKAESEARKKQHAEDVAKRRAADIIFLGRGVSGGLADWRANIEQLQKLGLPLLATPADVAKALGLEIKRLRWLAFHAETAVVTHYVRFQVPKKSGGTRELSAPHRDLSAAQHWILENILNKIPLHDSAHGFVIGRSTMSNAVPHVRKEVVVNADLKDFFPSITFPRVKGVFQELGYSPAAATVLALLCTECPRRKVVYAGQELHVAAGPRGLPQGACTSPAISNLVARRFDARLTGLARKCGWGYTRYADDITFSASGVPTNLTAYMLARLRHIAQDENFTVNETKTRVQRPNSAQTVTGIVVNHRPNVPRDMVRRVRAILHRAKTEGLAAQNREQHPHFEGWVRGMIAYIYMVNPRRGEELKRQFEAVRSGA